MNICLIDGQSVALGNSFTQAGLDAYLAAGPFNITGILVQAYLDSILDPPLWNLDRTRYQMGLRTLADMSTVIGPTIDMLRRLNDVEPGQWTALNFALSSSSMAMWGRDSSHGKLDPTGKNIVNQMVDAAKAIALATGGTIRYSARFQFEADAALANTANAWRNLMMAHRDFLWSHFGEDFQIILARCNINTSTAFGLSVIRPAQEHLATQPGFAIVDMDSYPMEADGIHYPPSSNLLMGRAFADKWFAIKPLPLVDQLDAPGSSVLLIDQAIRRLFGRRYDLAVAALKTAAMRGYTGVDASSDTAVRKLGQALAAAIRNGTLVP